MSTATPRLRALALGVLAIFLALPAAAQTGTLQGRVIEARTGEPLPGANVVVRGTTLGAATDPDGRFVLRGVPAGAGTLDVSFIGYEPAARPFALAPDGRETVDAGLASAALTGREVVVEAVVRGQARALNQQRNAAAIQNVISHEQLEGFADETVTEALRRLPGATADHDRGEPDGLRLRGLGPALHTVTVDGQRMASTELGQRTTDLSGVPADLVASIEVTKAFTPDMFGDATSGGVNIVTRRPLGSARLLQGRLALGYNDLAGRFGSAADGTNYRGALTYGQRTPAYSYVLNGSVRRDGRFQEDIRHQWGLQPGVDRPVLTILEPSAYPIRRDLTTLAGTLDLYPSRITTLSVRSSYNRRTDDQERHQFTMDIGRGTFRPDNTTTGARGRITIAARTYTNTRDQANVSLGAEHAWDRLQLDYGLSAALGQEVRSPTYYYDFRASGFDFRVDDSDRRYSRAEVITGDAMDASRYAFQRFQQDRLDARDRDLALRLNAETPLALGAGRLRLKGGLYGSARALSGRQFRERFPALAAGATLRPTDLGLRAFDGLLGRYPIPMAIHWPDGVQAFTSAPERFVLDRNYSQAYSASLDYSGTENVGAAYAMGTFEAGPVLVLAGARVEATQQAYRGLRARTEAGGTFAGTEPVSASRAYANVLPAFHVRYALDGQTNLRFAATRTISRAPFEQLSPVRVEDFDGRELRLGNPDLRPVRFTNLDLLGERFFRSVGVVSGGVFFKYAQDVVVNRSQTLTGGEFDGFIEVQPVNANDAYVGGVEAAWQQQLRFLPGPLAGLGVFANYTYTYTAADYGRDRRYPLLGTTPHVVNAALSYGLGGFATQLSLSRQSTTFYDTATRLPDAITATQPFDFADRYRRIGTSLDLTASQRVGTAETFLEVNNLLNSRNFDYYGSPDFPYRENGHSWYANLGVRVNL